MKKILLSILMLCCMTAAWAEGTGGFIEVSTPNGLKEAIQKDNSAHIKLVADIDISNLGTICDVFKGHIYGKYKYTNKVGELRDTVYSLKGGGKEIPRIFNKLDHADIDYIMLDDFTVKGKGDVVGALAGTASYTNFNYMMTNKVVVSSEDDNVGGLVGNADHCHFEGVSINFSSVRSDETIVGGMVGESHQCTFSYCVTYRSTVFADGAWLSNYARVGGFSGYSVGDTFTNCVNTSVVGGTEDSVGGFAGRSDGTRFLQCTNSGVIIHANEDDFNKVVEIVDKMYEDQSTLSQAAREAAIISSAFAAHVVVGADLLLWVGSVGFETLGATVACIGFTCGTVLVIAGITAYLTWLTTLHDEIGGFCGQANGGEFLICTNSGFINCKDSQGGGIVGRANGVTVDNCLNNNNCKWGDDDCGGIIGGASGGCKVTNCLNISESPLIGEAENMNPASGNNYGLGRSIVWQDPVDTQDLASGFVTYWLNNGVENREKGITPWSQNIGSDNCPLLDLNHNLVTRDMLFDMEIGTVDELRKFAEKVNFGNVYTSAKLVADIDMTNEWWTPIGYNEWGHRFCGIFDGQGHTIKGLTYKSDERPAGLFGCVTTNAEIRNVIIGEGSEFRNSSDGAGAIVGRVHYDWTCGNVIIENCGSYANVSGVKHAGGILGRVSTGDESDGVKVYINNCFSHGIITADDGNSGLISGYMKDHGYVSNCWSNAYLRISEGHSSLPYGCERDINECFVGYDTKLNISNCFITDPGTHIDSYSKYKLQSGVTVVTSDELAIGKVTYSLNRSNAVNNKELIWQQNIGNDGSPTFGNKGLYHSRSRKVGGSKYATVCLPFRVKSNDKISYYDHKYNLDNTDSEGVTLGFKYEEEYIGQGQPVLYRVHDDFPSVCFECADQTWFADQPQNTRFNDWDMFGTYKQMTLTEDSEPSSKEVYYLSGDKIHNARKTTIAPYHAFFMGPNVETLIGSGTSQAKAIRFILEEEDGSTTALESVANDLMPVHLNSKTYSLMGTEVNNSYRGIVIKNGKKYINR